MTLILLIDVLLVSVLIVGVATVLGWRSGRRWRYALGATTVLLAGVTSPFWSILWPFDWLAPAPSTRASAQLGEYRINYVQYPGGDFYADRLEVTHPRGKSAFIALVPDSGKCWVGWTVSIDTGVEFHCLGVGRIAAVETLWLVGQMEACANSPCDLSAKWYSRR
jgi:hypothetical protein